MFIPRLSALAALTLSFGLGLAQTTTTTATATTSATAAASTVTQALSQLRLSSDFVITNVPATRTYNWVVSTATGSPDGYYRPMLVVNGENDLQRSLYHPSLTSKTGQYPGPLIEANEGDTIIVNVQNDMSLGTTIHWHGMYQKGTPWMDGPAGITQCPIPAGSSFTYEFTVTGQYGTYWWHAHASTQLADGIHGPLIIHSPDDPLKRGVDFDEEQVLVVADWYHDTSAVITSALLSPGGYQGSIAAPSPNSALINGRGTWDCATYGNSSTCFTQTPVEIQVVPNKKYRFRLINSAAHAMFWYSIDSHTLNVTEADDTPVFSQANSALHRLRFHDGQRYSVIVDTSVGSVGDAYWMRAEMNTACLTTLPTDFAGTTYAIMRYVDEVGSSTATTADPTSSDWTDVLGTECRDIDTASLVPIVAQNAPTTVVQRRLIDTAFSIAFDANGNLDAGFAVNGTSFTDYVYKPILHQVNQGLTVNSSNVASVTYTEAGAVDLIINNLDTGIDHPYHHSAEEDSIVHGMSFWIVGEGSGTLTLAQAETITYNTTNPIRRDTHVIPANTWAVLRFEATNPGVWFLHCHIDWHLAEGFAAVIVVQPDAVAQMTIPSSSTDLCNNIPAGLTSDSTSLGRRSLPGAKKFGGFGVYA
ncbi:laccase, multicopper oxidase, benzenediol:oxygen oxidorectuctase [Ceratobasidium sp. 370]|nr:laccase, multicopper oxidase, benzenediol:oxygen oxidorectuctase [Ceratobasidium sp. 370]